jgi:hypothetical protein
MVADAAHTTERPSSIVQRNRSTHSILEKRKAGEVDDNKAMVIGKP